MSKKNGLTIVVISAATALAGSSPAQARSLDSGLTSVSTHRAGGVGPANARNGVCEVEEFCLYYNSNQQGSVFDIWSYDRDLRGNVFLGPGAGKGRVVANDAASFWNRSNECTFHVHTAPFYGGRHGYVSPNRYGNFSSAFKNNVESVRSTPDYC